MAPIQVHDDVQPAQERQAALAFSPVGWRIYTRLNRLAEQLEPYATVTSNPDLAAAGHSISAALAGWQATQELGRYQLWAGASGHAHKTRQHLMEAVLCLRRFTQENPSRGERWQQAAKEIHGLVDAAHEQLEQYATAGLVSQANGHVATVQPPAQEEES